MASEKAQRRAVPSDAHGWSVDRRAGETRDFAIMLWDIDHGAPNKPSLYRARLTITRDSGQMGVKMTGRRDSFVEKSI